MVRAVENNLPSRVNQTCRLISRAGCVGCSLLDGFVVGPEDEADVDGLAAPGGALPSEPAGAAPHAAASKPTPMIRMGRRFMADSFTCPYATHIAAARPPAVHRNLTVPSHRQPAPSEE
jgi:hypothetical protein